MPAPARRRSLTIVPGGGRKARAGAGRAVSGFTLLEVLVALAVLASVLAAGLQIAGGSAARAARLEELTYASWVAFNRLAEIDLAAQWPADLEVRDAVTMGGRGWDRLTRVTETPDPAVRWVRVEVRSGGHERSSSGSERSAAVSTRTALVAKHP